MITGFWRAVNACGDAPAIYLQDDTVFTYNQLVKGADEIGRRMGQEKRLVQIFMDNSIGSIVAYIGALRGGHGVLLQDKENMALAENLRKTYRPDAVFDQETGLVINSEPNPDLHPDLALLLSTSGSTGSSKAVRLSFDNLASNAQAIAQYLEISSREKALLTLPLHYCYGLSVLNSHLEKGGAVIAGINSVTDQEFYSRLQESEATSFAGVPFSFELMERTGFRDLDFPHLRYITQAGGRLNKELVQKYHQWAREKGKKFFVMYGQTEATARIAYLAPDMAAMYPTCIGKPIPGGTLEIRDDEGDRVTEADQPGELVYLGPNVMSGYAEKKEDLSRGKEVVALYTGDIGCRNSEGLYYLVGRKKRIAKLYGIRLNLDQVEIWARQSGLGAAYCVSDDTRLYLVFAEHVDHQHVVQLVNQQYKLSHKDIQTIILEELPLMSSGKVDYQTLLEYCHQHTRELEQSQENTAEEGTDKKTTLQRLVDTYEKNLSLKNIPVEESFVSLGGDSLSYLAISVEIEKNLGTLPRSWETIPINNLPDYKKQRFSAFWSQIEVSVLLRFIAPLAIVMNHSGLGFLAGGAALLLIVSGFNFNRFSTKDMLALNYGQILKLFFQNILIPYWLILVVYQAYRGDFSLLEILLVNNLVGDHAVAPFNTWFIQALFQSVLITLVFFIPQILRKLCKHQAFLVGMVLLSLALGARVLDEYVFSELLSNKGKQISWVFWLFVLGWTCASCKNISHRMILSFVTVVSPLICYANDYPRIMFISVGGLLLIWLQCIGVPSLLVPMIGVIGSSSLFIYMTHQLAPISSFAAAWPVDVVRIVTGLLMGVVTWYLYHLVLKYLAVIAGLTLGRRRVREEP